MDGWSKSGSSAKQNQWNRRTKSMELLNEANGIVERNQWILFAKVAVLMSKAATFVDEKHHVMSRNTIKPPSNTTKHPSPVLKNAKMTSPTLLNYTNHSPPSHTCE
jgi:hypothetical protein